VVQRDPRLDAQKAANEAAAKANQVTAVRKKQYRANSLLATSAQGVTSGAPATLLGSYKQTLGE
jgi:hypothetical protein